jgi:hypothetical protein
MEEMRNSNEILFGIPEGLGDFCIYQSIILKWILRKMRCEDVDLIHLAQDWVQWNTGEHGNEPSNSIKGGEFLD